VPDHFKKGVSGEKLIILEDETLMNIQPQKARYKSMRVPHGSRILIISKLIRIYTFENKHDSDN